MEIKSLVELSAMTKEELISLILGNENQNKSVCAKSFDSPNGQISREFVTTDSKGNVLFKDVWNWTYTKDGLVDEITHVVLDDKKNILLADKITHSDSGVIKRSLDIKQLPAEMLSARESLTDATLIEDPEIEIIGEKTTGLGEEIKTP